MSPPAIELTLLIVVLLVGSLATESLPGAVPTCVEARLRCAYRTGCGAALNNYMMWCTDVLSGDPDICPERCQHALIALTSTEEGKHLMNCECNDDYCLESKTRIDICRPQVLKAAENETVSCRVSQLICAADALCSTALEYYHRYCRSMFHGKKCSHRCLNSINILRRQEKAAKLATCKCDGFEEYDCPRIQTNMARLCFHKKWPEVPAESGGEEKVSSKNVEENQRPKHPNDVMAGVAAGAADVRRNLCPTLLFAIAIAVQVLGKT